MPSALDDDNQMVRYDRQGNIVPVQPNPLPPAVEREIGNVREAAQQAAGYVPEPLRRGFGPAIDPQGSGGVVQYNPQGNLQSYQSAPYPPGSEAVAGAANAAADYLRDRASALQATAPTGPAPPSPNVPVNVAPSDATRAIVAARDTGGEPAVEGQRPMVSALAGAAGSVLSAAGAGAPESTPQGPSATDVADAARYAVTPTKRDESGVVAEAKVPNVPQTTKSATATEGPPKAAPATVVQSGAPQAPQAAPKVDLKKPIEPKGAPGGRSAPSALAPRERDQLPPANEKARISPTFLVELEKSNPALHDGIIQAATAAGIGSWDYANLIYGTSKGDPNYNQGGRVGLAGLTQADIDRYQARPDTAALFRDVNGNPVTAQDPHTNLMLGAVKYREMSDRYGTRNPQAILAYHIGADKVDSLSTLTPKEQASMIPAESQAQVQQSISGPDTGVVKPTPVNLQPPGTMTPTGVAQAAFAAARTGNTMPFIGYVANGVPRGTGPTDSWRYAENAMVAAMMAKGDMQGAQHARELVFQMSHTGAVQSFMSAYRQMQLGDYHGAAQSLALGYWASPDGGLVQFAVGKDKDGNNVMYGQRYNEETRKPLGATFQVRPQDVIDLTSMARDPATFQKMVNDNRKLNNEIANKEADTEYKKAHTQTEKVRAVAIARGDIRADERVEDAAGATVVRGTQPRGKAAPAVDPMWEKIEKEVDEEYKVIDQETGARKMLTPAMALESDILKDMRHNNPSMSTSSGRVVANGVVTGTYGVKANPDKPGWGIVYDKNTQRVTGELKPNVMGRISGGRPSTTTPAPGLGAR